MILLENLKRIIPPPETPVFGGSINWVVIESKYNIFVPNDFKDLISVYGSGAIDGFVWLLNPASTNCHLNFDKSSYFLSSYRVMKEEFPDDYPRPPYPERDSFFPWAVTDNGETFVWIVSGTPIEWKVGIHSVDQSIEEIYSMGTVEFLISLLRKEVKSRILPSQFPSENPQFLTA